MRSILGQSIVIQWCIKLLVWWCSNLIVTVNSKPKPKRGTIQQELVRFEELYTKFGRTKSMNKTNGILHLLLQLSNDPRVIASDHGNAPVVSPAQGSVIESVFSSKLANQVAYRAQ